MHMTTEQAFKYFIDSARELGYSYAEVFAFSDEIYEKLNLLPETSLDVVDSLIEEIL